ncbi:receptor-like protein 35 [Lycium ferocissimum]|uniref:receptor-like protein 35 n=1 Tax=Lycium ferocissimum TaxID=112874 RepID=UPI0028156D07|nr:receptor-like protein 35 [Lycium ferocissimum]
MGNLTNLVYLDLSYNRFTGSIPLFHKAKTLNRIDISNNNGPLSYAKTQLAVLLSLPSLQFLSFQNRRNKLSGIIPDTFLQNCNLRILDLNSNILEGKFPKSLQGCAFLEVLDIGNNKIRNTFPCMLKKFSNLHVLVLRSNMFHWNLRCPIANNETWSKLQIIDLSANNFSGSLPTRYFSSWQGMMLSSNPDQVGSKPLEVQLQAVGIFYQVRVTLTLKGQLMEIENILEVFTAIDFSCNNFQGEIPKVLGDLNSLYLLNLSHNALTGRIPKALGKLSQLGSLDLSVNHLSGRIPDELASLTFLSVLNLSFTQLSGRIPRGNQLQMFLENSFEGNTGLCDFPLKKYSDTEATRPSQFPSDHSEPETIDGKYISFALGSSVCSGIVTWLLLFSPRYNELVDRLLFRIFGQHNIAGRNGNRRR